MSDRAPRCWALVPAKAPGVGKSRLASALGDAERAALVETMLAHVLDTLLDSAAVERVLLLGPDRPSLDPRIERIDEAGDGLNAALDTAFREIAARPGAPDRLIVIHGDLPLLQRADVRLLCTVPDDKIGIAPDRHGVGTNALSLPLPRAREFVFRFGTDSAARHVREAEEHIFGIQTILSDGLEKDIDEPVDLGMPNMCSAPRRRG